MVLFFTNQQLRIKFKDNLEDVFEYQSEASLLRDFADQEFDSIDSLQSESTVTNGHSDQPAETIESTDESAMMTADQPPPVPKRTKPRTVSHGTLRNNTVIGSMSGNEADYDDVM